MNDKKAIFTQRQARISWKSRYWFHSHCIGGSQPCLIAITLTMEWLSGFIYTVTECVGSFELGFALSTSYRKTTEKVNVGENHIYGVAASL